MRSSFGKTGETSRVKRKSALTPSHTPPPVFFQDATAFRTWLEQHAASATELIVGYHKVATGLPSMSWSESVDEALCFGWIDGVRRRIDDQSYQIRFTPRRPTSIWSAVNIAKVEALNAQGRMKPAGLAAFAQRREDKSRVYSHEQAAAAELTPAETRAFKRNKPAWNHFQAAAPSDRKAVVHWVTSAKQATTRERRFAQLLATCIAGERLR
jgi:uncharacterized protein YdeI (YjbR/CyaY-like superfamily)